MGFFDFLKGPATNATLKTVGTSKKKVLKNIEKQGGGYKRPKIPEYNSIYSSSMAMQPKVQQGLLGMQGFNQFRDEALRQGQSPWASMALQKQGLEESSALERAKQEAASSAAQAQSNLAMRGGLSSGARERLAGAGAQNMLAMSQDIGRQGGLNRLGIGMQDEQNRIARLSQLPGMELSQQSLLADVGQNDVRNMMQENLARNAYNMNNYNQQMKVLAANKTAQAMEESGK